VVFYARLGKERGSFSFDTVVEAICRKLIERHPHVFAGGEVAGAEEQSLRWEQAKAQRRRESPGEGGALDGITPGLPAMTRAAKLQRRASNAGFDWPAVEPVMDKVAEELNELRAVAAEDLSAREAEVGDLLFACVNVARHLGIDPEQALRGANRRFEERFRYVEARLRGQNRELGEASLAEMDALWEEAKRNEH
jgi:ATP diphosphatase